MTLESAILPARTTAYKAVAHSIKLAEDKADIERTHPHGVAIASSRWEPGGRP